MTVPPVTVLGELFELRASISNRLWSCERVILKMSLNDNFIVTGNTSTLLEVHYMYVYNYFVQLFFNSFTFLFEYLGSFPTTVGLLCVLNGYDLRRADSAVPGAAMGG